MLGISGRNQFTLILLVTIAIDRFRKLTGNADRYPFH